MKRDDLVARLRQIETLVAECLLAAGEKPAPPSTARKADSSKRAKNALPDKIIGLRDSGFFAQPKTASDVRTKLNPTYACEFDRVSMALLRLGTRRKLRKASKVVAGKKQVAYVW
jgi:hypothetical protein